MGAPGDEPAWTFVTSKRNRHSGKKPSRPATVLGCNAAPPPRRTTAHLSVEKIRSDHKKFSQQWSDSEGCRKFKDLLERMPCSDLPRKAICLGLGSFDPEDGSWQVRKRSHVQLAAFRTLVECIATADAPADAHLIRCIFQEPCFTAADKEYLESLGYEVVESPRGFEEVSEDSILFGIHLYRDIYSAAIAKAMPTMFIGTGYDVWDRYDPLVLVESVLGNQVLTNIGCV